MKRLKLGLGLLSFFLLYLGLEQLIETQTHGFSVQRILAEDIPYQPRWCIPPLSPEEKEHVRTLLNQPFYLLGGGSECFAFLGRDNQTVIKFFKLDHIRPVYLYQGLLMKDYSAHASSLSPSTYPPHSWRSKLAGIRAFRVQRTFDSLLLAYTQLREETGLLYLHLNPSTEWKKTLTLYDACGIAHTIDLDSTRFVLQKRAVPFPQHLKNLIAQGDYARAKQELNTLLSFILHRCQKGLSDRDIVCRNFGFRDGHPQEIDTGSFGLLPQMKERWLYKQELFYAALELRYWVQKYEPYLAHYLNKTAPLSFLPQNQEKSYE